MPNQSEKRNYNTNLVWFNKIQKRFLCMYGGIRKKNVRIMRKLGAFTQRIVFFSFYPRFRNIIKYLKCIYFCGSYGPPSLSSDTYTNIWAKKFGSARSALLHTRPSRNWLSALLRCVYTQRNLLETLLDQPEIRLYLQCTNWLGSKRTSVWFKINRKMVNTTWFRFDSIRFRKDFSVCVSPGSGRHD